MEEEISLVELQDITTDDPAAVRRKLRRRETVTDNPLAIDMIYAQRFTVLRKSDEDVFMQKLTQYAERLLSDAHIGIVFFKAEIFSNANVKQKTLRCVGDACKTEFAVTLHTFAEECLTESKVKIIEDQYLPSLINGSSGKPVAKLMSTDLVTHHDTMFRKPVYK